MIARNLADLAAESRRYSRLTVFGCRRNRFSFTSRDRQERRRPYDLRMPRMEGAEATRHICAALPDTQVLVLTTYADDKSLFPALQAGARGNLTKDASAEEIEQAVRALVAGETHLDPTVQQRLVAAVLDTKPIPDAPAQSLPDDLTPRVPLPGSVSPVLSASGGRCPRTPVASRG